jgi:hypothetical protein
MATTPAFAATPVTGHASPSATADAEYGSTDAPAHAVVLLAGGANGTKVEEIDCVGTGETVAGNLIVFIYDGTTYWPVDNFLVTVVTPSTTVAPYSATHTFNNLFVPLGSSLYITSAVASQLVAVTAYGGDF